MKFELFDVFHAHAALFPESGVQDYIKLIYQNEFAGGHMITSETDSLELLLSEYESCKVNIFNDICPKYFHIGNYLIRANIRKFDIAQLKDLNTAFIETANTHVGHVCSLQSKLRLLYNKHVLEMLCEPRETVAQEVKNYIKQGCRMLHHSEQFRLTYSPAYRVINVKYVEQLEDML